MNNQFNIIPCKPHHVMGVVRSSEGRLSEQDVRAFCAGPVNEPKKAHILWLAEDTLDDNADPAGFAMCVKTRQFQSIIGLWVVPHYRGRGVGTALLDKHISRMTERNHQTLTVDAPDEDVVFHNWLVKKGFVASAVFRAERVYRFTLLYDWLTPETASVSVANHCAGKQHRGSHT